MNNLKNWEEKLYMTGLVKDSCTLRPASEDEDATIWEVCRKEDNAFVARFNTEAAAIDYCEWLYGRSNDAQYSLLEAVADIAYFAGYKKYYSGDSRADMSYFIHLAKEFEAKHEGIEWGLDLDYIETMEQYCSEVFDSSFFNQL